MISTDTDSLDSMHAEYDTDSSLDQTSNYSNSKYIDHKKLKILVNNNKGLIYYDNELIGDVDKNSIVNILLLKQHIYNNNSAIIEQAVADAIPKIINSGATLKIKVVKFKKRKGCCFC